jgi:hypothetical protein
LKITSWRYPRRESLERMIEEKNLYPVTILKSVKGLVRDGLFQAGIMLVKDLSNYELEDLKRKTGLPQDTLNKIMEEVRKVCIC